MTKSKQHLILLAVPSSTGFLACYAAYRLIHEEGTEGKVMQHVLVCSKEKKVKNLQQLLGDDFNVETQTSIPQPDQLEAMKMPDCVVIDVAIDGGESFLMTLTDKDRASIVLICIVDDFEQRCFYKHSSNDAFQRQSLSPEVLAARIQEFCERKTQQKHHQRAVATATN